MSVHFSKDQSTEDAGRPPRRALRMPAVMERVGLSRAGIYRLIQLGDFPAQHKLTERVSAWDEAEVSAWLDAKLGARTGVIK